MLNRIRKNIQDNYSYCGIIHKPTAKQNAFLEDKIMAQQLEDKDEYRLYYRILKAEEAMLCEDWDSISHYIFGDAETGAIVLQIGKHIIPKPIQYQIAIRLYTNKGDMYGEISDIPKCIANCNTNCKISLCKFWNFSGIYRKKLSHCYVVTRRKICDAVSK